MVDHYIHQSEVQGLFPRVRENPFNSERKMMSVLSQVGGQVDPVLSKTVLAGATHVAIVKGAPNMVLAKCNKAVSNNGVSAPLSSLDEAGRQQLLKVVDDLSAQALRVLAIAYKVRTLVLRVLFRPQIHLC